MAKLTVAQQKQIKELEQKVREDNKLWNIIKHIPEEDRGFQKELKELVKRHKLKNKPKSNPKLKELANKLFGGFQPSEPLKKKKANKRRKAKKK